MTRPSPPAGPSPPADPAPGTTTGAGMLLPPDPADLPVLALGLDRAIWLVPGRAAEQIDLQVARRRAGSGTPLMICHAAAAARRLRLERLIAFDLLELFAFVAPARFCLPTPRGLARSLGLPVPASLEAEAALLPQAARRLLERLARRPDPEAAAVARAMAAGGWPWGPAVLAALGFGSADRLSGSAGLRVWQRLPEWSEHAPETAAGSVPVDPAETRARLAALLGQGAEERPSQADYASAVTAAFQPRGEPDGPELVLAEAGTGVGKTLGYVAPASLWAEKNRGAVWISTFTRNLQHQIDGELDRLHPDPAVKARRVVLRKGRENYLCLLNMEEAVGTLAARPEGAVPLGLMARWARVTRDGDMVGGDFPAWLADLAGRPRTLGLTDRRGECVHSACPHYSRCFIERSLHRARRADIVVANHALVMVQAAIGGLDDAHLPTRYVFDEGHHLFDAADGAFSAVLSGQETAELRRWLIGSEAGARSRGRGLERRIGDLAALDSDAAAALGAALQGARALPGEGWLRRLDDPTQAGPAESFLALVRRQVLARAPGAASPHGIEAETQPPIDGLIAAARQLDTALAAIADPLAVLQDRLATLLDEMAEDLDTASRLRLEAANRSLDRRALIPLRIWRSMLKSLEGTPPEEFVDWFGVDRFEGRDTDVGLHRHWIDPTIPFARAVLTPAHGVLITSATLRDGTGEVEADWAAAETRTGTVHLAQPPRRAAVPSPYDYPAQTRVLIVTDVRKDDLDQVAAAYRALFLAAGGGSLGLFTAISRLRAVRERIAPALDRAGLPLLAQHVDPLDTSTLVAVFRAEETSCLLGTDAVRDGVDVPGRALRLIVFDRVPWPRPDLLHRARRAAFGGRGYDDRIARFRLKQAYGRLIRRADDTGVFVLLDPMMPSRLFGAFPEGVQPQRVGLAEAVATTRAFLAPPQPAAETGGAATDP